MSVDLTIRCIMCKNEQAVWAVEDSKEKIHCLCNKCKEDRHSNGDMQAIKKILERR